MKPIEFKPLQLKTMLELQDSMNKKVHPEWRFQNFPWYRAIWTECAEMADHYGWKWWKKQEPDMPQVALELVDIWHFGISIILMRNSGSVQESVDVLMRGCQNFEPLGTENDFIAAMEVFVHYTITTRGFYIPAFIQMMRLAGLTADDLYRQYVGKNVLNFFRQDNGYKDGSYRKHWHDGREDNEHLVEVLADLDIDSETFKDDVRIGLQARYVLGLAA